MFALDSLEQSPLTINTGHEVKVQFDVERCGTVQCMDGPTTERLLSNGSASAEKEASRQMIAVDRGIDIQPGICKILDEPWLMLRQR